MNEGITIKNGPFSSKLVYINGSTLETFNKTIAVLKEEVKGAIFVIIPKHELKIYLDIMIKEYKPHYISPIDGSYTYYIWTDTSVEDKVAEAATSIEGIAALILSPDLTEVLLVHEYGKWKAVTGSVKSGDTKLDTLFREVKEETNIDIDETTEPMYVGGWNRCKAKYGIFNDNLSAYAVKSASKEFKVDGYEIKNGKWFSIDYLMAIDTNVAITDDPYRFSIEHNGDKFSYPMLKWLENYTKGKFFNISKGNTHLVY